MKTTIDISNILFFKTKQFAGKQGRTFKEIVEMALSQYLTKKKPKQHFKLNKHPFKGDGLVEDLQEGDWISMRSRAYEGHGG